MLLLMLRHTHCLLLPLVLHETHHTFDNPTVPLLLLLAYTLIVEALRQLLPERLQQYTVLLMAAVLKASSCSSTITGSSTCSQ
jgi:hypothetical protein